MYGSFTSLGLGWPCWFTSPGRTPKDPAQSVTGDVRRAGSEDPGLGSHRRTFIHISVPLGRPTLKSVLFFSGC